MRAIIMERTINCGEKHCCSRPGDFCEDYLYTGTEGALCRCFGEELSFDDFSALRCRECLAADRGEIEEGSVTVDLGTGEVAAAADGREALGPSDGLDTPTAPGMYYFTGRVGASMGDWVWIDEDIQDGPNAFCAFRFGIDLAFTLAEFGAGKWYGPIAPPAPSSETREK